ncbi:MAG: hypothetical protein JO119_12460 [Acidobacteria bacterium]|nr:hypothetical protein [Acidobacteriota bacterium]
METLAKRNRCLLMGLVAALTLLLSNGPIAAALGSDPLEDLLQRTDAHVSQFLALISEVNCSEHVLQERLDEKGRTQEKQESSFDYLIMLSNADGELNLVESRIAPDEDKHAKKPHKPLLVSNGFPALFLVFHPYYASSFQFTSSGQEVLDGKSYSRVEFRHIPGMKSPAALAVRGREYPLEIVGTAWIDPSTGIIAKLTANIDSGMEDIGLRTLHSEVRFAPVTFRGAQEAFWFPAQATVEVESLHEHWRNTHRFSDYKRFSVDTKEQAQKQ